PTAPTAPIPSTLDPATCLRLLLDGNFDAVSVPAVTTLARYVGNVLQQPGEEKFRRIKTDNKAFREKVGAAKGAVELLLALGFLPQGDGGVGGAAVLELATEEGSELERLRGGWAMLLGALGELGVPEEDRPRMDLQVQRRQQAQQQAAVVFDPYKAFVVRAAPQPVRPSAGEEGGMAQSSTERQLQQLRRRRRELQGCAEDVVRDTEVLLPMAQGVSGQSGEKGSSSSSSYVDAGVAMEVEDEGPGMSVPRSVLQQILKKEEEKPLTTQAVRDLQRAQKERVYARTLIKIK
ncbi:hypothetical protein B484DRAFT_438374, partial [Ochromonadaceae sp. CCMP2298]